MKTEIISTIRETFYLAEGQISEDTLIDDIAKDSMDIVELIAVLSNKYHLVINSSEMTGIKTIGDIVEYTMRHIDKNSSNTPLDSF